MISREQALSIADQWLNGRAAPQQRRQIGLHEFDLGYVVWALVPPVQGSPGQRRPPGEVGGATGVVDRWSGELTTWPPIPVEDIVRMYRDQQETVRHTAPPRPVPMPAPVGGPRVMPRGMPGGGPVGGPDNRPAVGPGNSVAVTYRDTRGMEVQLNQQSRPGLPHPLWQAWHELQQIGVPPQNVVAIHSELSACYLPGGYCDLLLKSFPLAEISYGHPYGESRESRAAAVAAVVADRAGGHPPTPRARPVPVSSDVPPAAPIDGAQLGQELAEVFGPQQIRRFHPDELTYSNLPVAARATLTSAGVPSTIPYFFRVAARVSPVHEHLRATNPGISEQLVEKLAATNSVVIGDDGNAVICVQCGGLEIDQGRLWAVDPDAGWARFVNTSVASFDRSLSLLVRARTALRGLDAYAAGSLVSDFQTRLVAVDPAALRDEANWWSLIVEQLWDGLL